MVSMRKLTPHPLNDVTQSNADPISPELIIRQQASLTRSDIMGDAVSAQSLGALAKLQAEIKEMETLTGLREALLALKRGAWAQAGEFALSVLDIDERHAQAWHILAISRDKCGDFVNSLKCYEKALALSPDNLNIANDLGRLAYRGQMFDLAEKFFGFVLAVDENDFEAINNMASTLRELSRLSDDAIELLRPTLEKHPEQPQLWNTLGTIVNAKGDIDTALIFYDEAIRLNADMHHAIYNRAHVKYLRGDKIDALADFTLAAEKFEDPFNKGNAQLAYAHALIGMGALKEGWQTYLDRDSDGIASRVNAVINKPRWDRISSLKGQHIFVCGEQGLGDEVMFASTLPDLLTELGPHGRLTLAVEPRLVPIFARAFPKARVMPHQTGVYETKYYRFFPELEADNDIDQWTFIADFLSRYRSDITDFPKSNIYFKPDPSRVAYWQQKLMAFGSGPKIGLSWKSLIKHSSRDRMYSPFALWEDILRLEGLVFVNLQYGDVSEEQKIAEAMGIKIFYPEINLKDDLDDLSALCLALDLIIGPANATINIAAAAGTPIFMMIMKNVWTTLGTDYYPWYPTIETFETDYRGDWTGVMQLIKNRLVIDFGARSIDQ